MGTFLQKIGEFLASVLPLSPFRGIIESIGSFEYLSWLNWFFPVGECIVVMTAWVAVIGTYYLYSIALRWIKAIH